MTTTFVTSPERDLTLMAKYGLGGAAVVDDTLVFAGGMALDLKTITRLPEAETIADETRMCFDGIASILKQADCSLRDIVKVNCYLTDDAYRGEFWSTFKEIFAPGPYPKRLTLVAGLAGDCRVELEVMAVKPGQEASLGGRRELLLPTSRGVSAGAATSRLVFTAGSSIDATTMQRVPEADTIFNETRVVLERIERTLKEAGCTLKDLAKVSCFVSDEAHRMDFVYAYRDLLAPGPYPSRATFSIGLAGDCRVQIDAIAVRPN